MLVVAAVIGRLCAQLLLCGVWLAGLDERLFEACSSASRISMNRFESIRFDAVRGTAHGGQHPRLWARQAGLRSRGFRGPDSANCGGHPRGNWRRGFARIPFQDIKLVRYWCSWPGHHCRLGPNRAPPTLWPGPTAIAPKASRA